MISVKIATPSGLYMSGECTQINARSMNGAFGLLENHMPAFVMLEISRLELEKNGVKKEYAIAGGMLHFKDNRVMILTDSIEGEEEIDLKRAEEARKRAEKRLQNQDSNVNMRRAEIALQKAINRINLDRKVHNYD